MKKKYIKLNLIALLIWFLPSCSESFLDVDNPNNLAVNTYYHTQTELATGVTAAYSTLRNVFSDMYWFTEVPTDNSYSPNDGQYENQAEQWIIPATHSYVASRWTNLYRSIAFSNLVVEEAPKVPMDPELINRYVAEAKFIRALDYFYLVRLWGDVPFITQTLTDPDDANAYLRESKDRIYTELIIPDLISISEVLPSVYAAVNKGRATSVAALMMLGEVYMTRGDYSAAEPVLKQALDAADANGYGMLSGADGYTKIFDPGNANNDEIIFEVQYTSGQSTRSGSKWNNWFAPKGSGLPDTIVKTGEGYGYNQVHSDLYNAFEPGDRRKASSIASFTVGSTEFYFTKKYLDPNLAKQYDANNDWIVYRYADLLLLYAECLNENGQTSTAIDYVNMIRTHPRTGLDALSTGLDQAAARDAIAKERRIELNMEGHRWFDLLRTGKTEEVMNAYFMLTPRPHSTELDNSPFTFTGRPLLFPIPDAEIKLNPALTQNTGY
jgi:tetratricopeptide (TPR) repeat protein